MACLKRRGKKEDQETKPKSINTKRNNDGSYTVIVDGGKYTLAGTTELIHFLNDIGV